MNFKKILFLGAHPDDEVSCSGSLIRFIKEGKQVFHAVFSFCEASIPKKYNIEKEFDKSLKIIGIYKENIFKYNYPVRHFPAHRQEILEDLILLKKKIKPDLVLIPSVVDIHQDHKTIHDEGVRAFKHSNVLGYEFVHNSICSFPHTFYVEITKNQFKQKAKAFNCYLSQKNKIYAKEDIIEGLAKIRGVQVDNCLAEAFETIRLKI